MLIVVGLGNVGESYTGTYHNVGFMCVEEIAGRLGLKFKKLQCRAITAEKEISGGTVVLAKPTTFMNLSGQAVKSLLQKYGATPSDLIVLVDDFDLPLGSLRLRGEGSGGTHNGLKNIVELLGTTEFKRIRVGIGNAHQGDAKDFVLSRVGAEQAPVLAESVRNAAAAVLEYIDCGDFEKVQRDYNKKL